MSDFTMPSPGADMVEGTLLEWLVKPGDTVHRGDVVAVVETAKAAVEIETFTDGVVGELLVEPGTKGPDADLDALGDGATFRAELELDSLDFLSFVEVLSEATGIRIDEDDYPRLATMRSSVDLLTSRSGAGAA